MRPTSDLQHYPVYASISLLFGSTSFESLPPFGRTVTKAQKAVSFEPPTGSDVRDFLDLKLSYENSNA